MCLDWLGGLLVHDVIDTIKHFDNDTIAEAAEVGSSPTKEYFAHIQLGKELIHQMNRP